LAGITVWNYLRLALQEPQIHLVPMRNFGKVYFQIIVPISIVISNLLKFGIQFCIAFLLSIIFRAAISLNAKVLFPFLIVVMGILGLGLGMFISSLVTKYRDFSYLIGFGVITDVCFSGGISYGIG
jgi:lipopolysaccharide transport system permease protein